MTPLEVSLKNALAATPGHSADLPVLIVTVGLPRSGKSTWARQQNLPMVNPDSVRLAMHGKPFLQEAEPWIWLQTKTMLKALFLAGHFVVILDATNTTRKRRSDWLNPMWQVMYKIFSTGPEECEKRAIATDRTDLVPVIRRMEEQWESLDTDEGPTLESWIKCD